MIRNPSSSLCSIRTKTSTRSSSRSSRPSPWTRRGRRLQRWASRRQRSGRPRSRRVWGTAWGRAMGERRRSRWARRGRRRSTTPSQDLAPPRIGLRGTRDRPFLTSTGITTSPAPSAASAPTPATSSTPLTTWWRSSGSWRRRRRVIPVELPVFTCTPTFRPTLLTSPEIQVISSAPLVRIYAASWSTWWQLSLRLTGTVSCKIMIVAAVRKRVQLSESSESTYGSFRPNYRSLSHDRPKKRAKFYSLLIHAHENMIYHCLVMLDIAEEPEELGLSQKDLSRIRSGNVCGFVQQQ